jgi:serine/threonine protein kinase
MKNVIGTQKSVKDPSSLPENFEEEREELIKLIQKQSKKAKFQVPQTTIQYYSLLKVIGRGAFGKVILAIHKLTGKRVAMKSIDKKYMKDEF